MRVLWYLKGFQYGDMSCCPWPYKHHTLIRLFVIISILGVLGCTQYAHRGFRLTSLDAKCPLPLSHVIVQGCSWLCQVCLSADDWLVLNWMRFFFLQFWTCSPKQTGHHNWTELSSIRICLTVEVGGYCCSSYLWNDQSLSPSRAVETFKLP